VFCKNLSGKGVTLRRPNKTPNKDIERNTIPNKANTRALRIRKEKIRNVFNIAPDERKIRETKAGKINMTIAIKIESVGLLVKYALSTTSAIFVSPISTGKSHL